jgi:hypothetical protein
VKYPLHTATSAEINNMRPSFGRDSRYGSWWTFPLEPYSDRKTCFAEVVPGIDTLIVPATASLLARIYFIRGTHSFYLFQVDVYLGRLYLSLVRTPDTVPSTRLSLVLNREIANANLRVPVMLEGENGCFIWAVWLILLCICLSLRSYGCDRL